MNIKIFIISLIFVSLFSCTQEERKPIHLDVAKLKEMKKAWQELNIKNYSFTYIFNTYMPSICIGYVKVENGVANVTFNSEYERIVPKPNDEKTKMFYINSMDGVFDNILNRYIKDKKEWENGKLDYFDYERIEYNPSYHFPEYISVSYEKPPIGGGCTEIGGRHLFIEIKDFEVSE